MQVTDKIDEKMKSTVEHLHEDLKHIRTSRADPAMLNTLKVEAYGTQMRLTELGSVTTPEARQILISPFDSQNLGAIKKAIETSNLNLNPITEGNSIRINVPPMDEKMRNEMAKLAKKKGEDAKISIRNARREGNDTLRQQKSSGEIAEDLMKSGENNIQKLTDKYCKQIDEIISCKEKDIMAI